MNWDCAVWTDPCTATTMPQLLRAAATAYGDDAAVRLDGETLPDDLITFAQLDARSAELARGLIARGVGKGTRIGFIFGNGPQFALILAATARIGAVAVPISTMIKANELVRVLRRSDIHGLIVQRRVLGHDMAARLSDALPQLTDATAGDLRIAQAPYLRWIVSDGDDLPSSFLHTDWLTARAGTVTGQLLREIENEVHPTDQMVEIYTSGSMALPKGVRHNHGPVLFRAHYLRGAMNVTRGKETTAVLPMFWIGGLMMYLMPNLAAGAVTVCTERTMSNSRMAMGSVLSDDDLKVLAAAPKPWWGLGMSETLGPYSYGDDFRAPGYPVCAPLDHFADGFDIRIAGADRNPAGDGEVGEMQVRGYPVTPGLHKIERDACFTPDGYYRTGDMCLVDGVRIHFVGRDGDMIKTAGSNVSPAEVEMEMQMLDGVHSAYVTGVPDKDRGQIVCAAVVPREGAVLDFAAIEAELRTRLSAYKVPRLYVEIMREDVPLLHSNKVSRRMITDLVAQRLGRDT